MRKILDWYYRYGSIAGIVVGLFIIISTQVLNQGGIDSVPFINRQGRQLPLSTSNGIWIGLIIIILSFKKRWIADLYKILSKKRKN